MKLLSIKDLAVVEGPGLLARAKKANVRYGISTGYVGLDNFFRGGGLLPGLLYVVGGRPGVGKTNFLLNIAKNIAEQNIPIAFFSLELTKERVLERLAYAQAEIDLMYYWQSGQEMPDSEVEKLKQAIKDIQKLPIYIEESTRITATNIRQELEKEAAKGIKIFFIDYLHIMASESKTYNREREVGVAVETIRDSAKQLGISCVLASQLNRQVEETSPFIPSLHNFRDSGTVEQVAFSVMALYRKDYYISTGMLVGEDGSELPLDGTMDILVLKNQDGLTGRVTLQFDGATGRIS